MTSSSLLVELIFVVLGLALVAAIIKYPRDAFITLPLGFLSIFAERFRTAVVLAASPIWVPVWVLDKYMKWGVFQHKFFSIFFESEEGDTDLPDIEYPINLKLKMDFKDYDTYFFTSESNHKKIKLILSEGLESIGKSLHLISMTKIGAETRIQLSGLDLYSFHWLVKCLQNDIKEGSVCGFSTHNDFSFIIIDDHKTLNNLVGKTSNNECYSFNLINGQHDFLAINNKIRIITKYKISTLKSYVSECGSGINAAQLQGSESLSS